MAADNVRKNMKFVCHCCKCCCNVLLAVSERGYPNHLVTSSFLAGIDAEKCVGCGKCAAACPINAIDMEAVPEPSAGKRRKALWTRQSAWGAASAPSNAPPLRAAWCGGSNG